MTFSLKENAATAAAFVDKCGVNADNDVYIVTVVF